MSGRLFRSLALLYPKTWRERYADEVADLSAELLAAGEVTLTAVGVGAAWFSLC